jgi:hypothetical protein
MSLEADSGKVLNVRNITAEYKPLHNTTAREYKSLKIVNAPSIVTHEDNQLHSQQWITCGMHGIYLYRRVLGHFRSTIWIAAYS